MVIHTEAIKGLTPADYLLIEKEHARLETFLNDLHDTCCKLDTLQSCQSCDKEKLASCRGRLPSFFYDIIDLADKHFYDEESIMLSRPNVTEEYEYFRNHHQAHANIMQELQRLAKSCDSLDKQGKTAEGYRKLYEGICGIFEEHSRAFDDPFIQSSIT